MPFKESVYFKDYGPKEILLEGLYIDGSHHKQWYIEQTLLKMGIDLDKISQEEDEYGDPMEWEPSIPA